MEKICLLLVLLMGVEAKSQYQFVKTGFSDGSLHRSKYCLHVALTGSSISDVAGGYRGSPIHFIVLSDSGSGTTSLADTLRVKETNVTLRVTGEVLVGGIVGTLAAFPCGPEPHSVAVKDGMRSVER